jgi:hypothetical protein
MVELSFHIYYPHNLFFLADNILQWDIHCRGFFKKEYPYLFLKLKKYLSAYRKMRKKYGWGENNLEKFFLVSHLSQSKKGLEKLPKKDKELLLKIINDLDLEIRDNWNAQKRILCSWKDVIEDYWKDNHSLAVKEIESFLNLKMPRKIKIFILLTTRGTGGGANLGKKGVTLEIGDLRIPLVKSFELLIHELIHFTELTNNKDTEIELKNLGLKNSGKVPETLLAKEAIVNLLCPNGLLSQKLNIGKCEICKPLDDNYQKKLYEYKKILESLVFDYFYNKDKKDYWSDFLPEMVKVLRKS